MISILLPIHNGIEFMNECILSILLQTYDDWELIICINGYPKDSPQYQYARQFEKPNKIKVYDSRANNKSDALNEMVQYARYDHIALIDVDDIWIKNKLEIQTQYLQYDVIGSQCVYFGERLNGVVPNIPLGDISNTNFLKCNPIINSSAIIKKEYCIWDGSLNLEDYDLWLRLKQTNKTFYNCDKILVKHRLHNNSAFNSKGNANKVPELLAKYQ